MSSPVQISEDEDSCNKIEDLQFISSDDDKDSSAIVDLLTSDEETELPEIKLKNKKKSEIVKALFPQTNVRNKHFSSDKCFPSTSKEALLKDPGFERMIEAVKVHLPVNPYGTQIALISQVIKAIKTSQNCLLESPTGSGKTLALLCGVLAWQRQERNRLGKVAADQLCSQHPEVSQVDGAVDFIASPRSKTNNIDNFFSKTVFGEKNIYDVPSNDVNKKSSSFKRQEPDSPVSHSPVKNLVSIHKKLRLEGGEQNQGKMLENLQKTPEKQVISQQQVETPENVRLPIIYYGARTHKQIQQVVKEFKRTSYCGEALMTVLASRDYTCIREFDKKIWNTKNDMCRGCIKTHQSRDKSNSESNCKFYDNRAALNHRTLPPGFDLEDLVDTGKRILSCPFYAARAMAQSAHIVFCPYNYLIEPAIRSSMNIELEGNIVVIDEAHNIEDICRNAATFTVTREQILAALKELQIVAEYRYATEDASSYIETLIKTLKNWDDWFVNQIPLVNQKPVNGQEAVHLWEVEHFVNTLDNHNIGRLQYTEFKSSSEMFCRKLREDPRTLTGVTQSTGSLLEDLETVLGYIFRSDCKFMDDFKPALVRTVHSTSDGNNVFHWRQSQFDKAIEKETLSLRLMCMNPAVVFESLKTAKCIILASGTLTPMHSFQSELATEFKLKVSRPHVIPSGRVWIGTLSTCPGGRRLECKARDTEQRDVQDGLGHAVRHVARVTPNGVLCFLPSYHLMNKLFKTWRDSGLWSDLEDVKHVFMESRNVKDHNEIMEDYYKCAVTSKGALLFAVYRGKVSEGMDFKDEQARAVITVGVPYPSTHDIAVCEKRKYNDRYSRQRGLLAGGEWLRVQAFRALNQAAGRCVRHRADWGAVLLLDARYTMPYYTEHLSSWLRQYMGDNHHSYESLVAGNGRNSLDEFMQRMSQETKT